MSELNYLTGWHSGKWPGGTYGLRFGQLRDILIEGRPVTIKIRLEGEAPFQAVLTRGFWNQCPEVRSPLIRDWILKQPVRRPWPKGLPPYFPVDRVGRNDFRVLFAS